MDIVASISVIVKGNVKGEAIVSKKPISFLGEIDPNEGKVVAKDNSLYGKTIKNKIFVFPEGRGSTVGSYVIYNLALNNKAPKAFVVKKAEPIIVAGAILAEIPLIEITENIMNAISSGDKIIIDSDKKLITIKKKNQKNPPKKLKN